MSKLLFLLRLVGRCLNYRLAHLGLIRPAGPLNLTYSVTNLCNSRCRTCSIWRIYREDKDRIKEELTLEEAEKFLRPLGRVWIFNISGGEPFLRRDLAQIVECAVRHCRPSVVHIPTNCVNVRRTLDGSREVIEAVKSTGREVHLTIKPSYDGIGRQHDEIRGVEGNFERVLEVLDGLKEMKADAPFLSVEIGTIISKMNVGNIEEIARYGAKLGVDSYRNEIAEQRLEMFNLDSDITPDAADYERAVALFKNELAREMRYRRFFQRATNAARWVYYDIAVEGLKTRRRVLPCYAGFANAHVSAYGDVWPCCILADSRPMGNLRDVDGDFRALWRSRRAAEVRRFVKQNQCACPLANQRYSDMLLHVPTLLKVLKHVLFVPKAPPETVPGRRG
jgi:MoaA/NifB/PqqE/SkfB family radical SAM enzyme